MYVLGTKHTYVDTYIPHSITWIDFEFFNYYELYLRTVSKWVRHISLVPWYSSLRGHSKQGDVSKIVTICLCRVQFSSVTQSRLTLCEPMDCSTLGFPAHHQLPELAQTHHHESVMPFNLSSSIQPSHPLQSWRTPNGVFKITFFKISLWL